MIPLKLQLHNFMSYGPNTQPLDFSGFDLACLTGNNGVGKSTLLDAMTWALWGKCRANFDDDLIRQGAFETWVIFEFILEGQKYRVVRKRSKGKRSQGSLEFLTQSSNQNQESFGDWTSLTRTTKAETQQKIIETIKMEYDTFINSAFLRQGHADEFTTRTPAERKAVLGEILNLEIYDQLEAQAKEQIKNKKIEKESLKNILEDIADQLQDKSRYKKQVEEIEKALAEVSKEIEEKEREVKKIQSEKEKLEAKASQCQALEKKIWESKQDSQDLDENIKKWDQNIKAALKLIKDKEIIEKNFVQYEKNKKFLDLYNQNLSQQLALNKQKAKLEKNLIEKRHNFEIEINKKIEKMKAIKKQIEQSGNELKEKKKSLLKVAICPLCRQDLTDQHKQKIFASLDQQLNQKRLDYQAILKEEEMLKKNLENIGEKVKELDDFKKLFEIDEKIKEIGYSEKEHAKLRKLVSDQEIYQKQKIQLENAQEKILTLQKEKARCEKMKERKDRTIQEDTKQKEKLLKDLKELNQIKDKLEHENRKLVKLREKISGVGKEYGAIKEKYSRLVKLEQEIEEKKKNLEKVSKEVSIFDELVLTFSKKGVQAMIIESVVPEIEEEANKLLNRMTDGKMKVKFITQKEKKTDGELTETLDIQIADEQGTRPYEMFSGGEAYRINFAIRIALSKLLARRAGAKLQFLVIDEGFGTQDILGKEHLVEAINSVTSDFKKILVITHDPEIKDVFPNRIEVTKDEEGSHFRIVE